MLKPFLGEALSKSSTVIFRHSLWRTPSNALQYYVMREKRKVNDTILPSGCEVHAINLGNKNMKISIFIGGASARLKNIFTDISRYPTGKHEINIHISLILNQSCMFMARVLSIATKFYCSQMYKILHQSNFRATQ